MTDDMLREADPYRPEVMQHLDGADHDLLDDIVAERRPSRLRRFAGPIAAAAAITAVVTVATLQHQPAGSPVAGPPASSPADSAAAAGSGSAAIALKAVEDNQRLLIEEPGWKATDVYGFAAQSGTIRFADGDRELEFDWYPASAYDSYYQDRLDVSPPVAVTVDGMVGNRFTYSPSDFAVMLKPRNGLFVEMRTGSTGWTLKSFAATLTHIRQVDARTFLAAMPPEIVTPERAGAAADKVLVDIPLPPGFTKAALQDLGANDPYQFGAEVTKVVGCGWIADWKRARAAGNEAEVKRAQNAMESSHHWQVLNQMNAAGEWPESFWEIADSMAKGRLVSGSEESLEC
jgi:hypothetical protein